MRRDQRFLRTRLTANHHLVMGLGMSINVDGNGNGNGNYLLA